MSLVALDGAYSVYIRAADDAPRPMPWRKPHRQLTWYLLVCSLDGMEEIRVDGKEYAVPEGASYLIPPGAPAEIGSRRGSRPAWIHFDVRWDPRRGRHPDIVRDDADWSERARMAQPGPKEVWGVDLPVRIPDPLQVLFAEGIPRVIRQWKRHTPIDIMESQHALQGLLTALVASIWQEQGTQGREDMAARIARAETIARESLGHVFGVSEFAAAAGLSRSRFSVVYHQVRGIPPARFLRDARLRQAEALLRASALPVAEIGSIVGYRDPSVFGRVFRRAHGVTPTRWRSDSLARPAGARA